MPASGFINSIGINLDVTNTVCLRKREEQEEGEEGEQQREQQRDREERERRETGGELQRESE
jgi:hypothetical protein